MRQIPGLNIQWPWSELLLNGRKTEETRTYALPARYEGVELAVIETPGQTGKVNGASRARIIGTITFNKSFAYLSKKKWIEDFDRHQITPSDPLFGWRPDKTKYG